MQLHVLHPHPAKQRAELLSTVVAGGYCVGCGVCAAVPGAGLAMSMDDAGRYVPVEAGDVGGDAAGYGVLDVCPFTNAGANEDAIAEELFARGAVGRTAEIGFHLATFAGHVAQGGFRERGSSGGFGSWLQEQLLNQGLIDAVLNVQADHAGGPLFRFQVASTVDQIRSAAKSRYYPVELSGVLGHIRAHPGRYAVVGVPCFLKAVRRMARHDAVIRERVRFCIGLICGHLKSAHYASFLGWQVGVHPARLRGINFRHKVPDRPPIEYSTVATAVDENGRLRDTEPARTTYGTDWGMGLFKLNACDYCDDVVAETADIVVGDAWLPRYMQDHRGVNVIVCRTPQMRAIVEAGMTSGQLALEPIAAAEVAASQAAGLRHRRQGLRYRLHLADRAGRWRPVKRLPAGWRHLTRKERARHRLRCQLAGTSHAAFLEALRAETLDAFRARIDPIIRRYYRTYRSDWDLLKAVVRRVVSQPRRLVKRCAEMVRDPGSSDARRRPDVSV